MKDSNISWTDHTFNPFIGCTPISAGCAQCYAQFQTFPRVQRLKGRELWGKGQPRHRTSAAYWKEPLKWNKLAAKWPWVCSDCNVLYANDETLGLPGICPHCNKLLSINRPKVFCGSMCDWLDDEVPIEWLADLLKLIHNTPFLNWLLLSKRIEKFFIQLKKADHHLDDRNYTFLTDWLDGCAPKNIWIGTTVENQEMADKRIPELLKIPAKIRFLSCEPLLSPIDLTDCGCGGAFRIAGTRPKGPCGQGIDWAIIGGESGKNHRECGIGWIHSIAAQCQAAGVPIFIKQDSGPKPGLQGRIPDELWNLKQFPKEG